MSDLHARLLAAVRQRMETAQAAADGDSGRWFMGDRWNVFRAEDEARYDENYGGEEHRLVVYGNVKDQSEHIAANDPATILRHCERDLKVVERHAPDEPIGNYVGCTHCYNDSGSEPWPCDDFLDMAAAYGIEVDG